MTRRRRRDALGEKRKVPDMDEVLFRREGAVEVITLNRPDKMNSFSYEMVKAIGTRIEEIQFEDEVRAVVITGEGRGFCTGADLAGSGGREDAFTAPGMRITTFSYSKMVSGIWALEKPVIGAINGVAAGAGCNFALACDLLIASEKAKFIQVFVRRGLVADAGGTYFLPRIVGLARAKELMFFGETIEAEQALEIGLVNRVVPAERLMDEAMEVATRLAKGPTRAMGMMKKMLNSSFESDLTTALEREAALQGIAVATADCVEGVTSFLQKRDPDFKGK
jgi:2-(1,2-epoxy-1,2-dihydrophenyl)acetyl-CoA isomerase